MFHSTFSGEGGITETDKIIQNLPGAGEVVDSSFVVATVVVIGTESEINKHCDDNGNVY